MPFFAGSTHPAVTEESMSRFTIGRRQFVSAVSVAVAFAALAPLARAAEPVTVRVGSAPGSASTSTLNEVLKKAGLKYTEVDRVFMAFPQHVIALQNKAVDASMTTEPSATRAIQSGAAVSIMGDDEIYPDHQLAVVLYSGQFIKDNPDAARRFMRAYLKAARD